MEISLELDVIRLYLHSKAFLLNLKNDGTTSILVFKNGQNYGFFTISQKIGQNSILDLHIRTLNRILHQIKLFLSYQNDQKCGFQAISPKLMMIES